MALERALTLLAAFEHRAEWRLVDIARETGLSEATALRYLSTLVHHQIVERDEEGLYRLGMRLFQLGQRAFGRRDVRQLALPHLERLRERFQETVNLAVCSQENVVIIEVLESTQSIRKGAALGETDQWHCSALGKAMLSLFPEPDARRILETHGLHPHTPHTITEIERLLEQLEQARRCGYAIDAEEGEVGLSCVAAPVRDHRGVVSYAISVSGPASRLVPDRVAEVGEAVAAAAELVSRSLGDVGTMSAANRARPGDWG